MGFRAGRRADGGRQPESRHDHRTLRKAGPGLELVLAVSAVRRLLHLRRRRDQPRAVRCAPKGESEIVAGFHVEYSGIAFATLFFLRRIRQHDPDLGAHRRCSSSAAGCRPFDGLPAAADNFLAQPSFFWLALKIVILHVLYILWFRATFPRYRYDQIMRLGWKALIPVTLVWIAVEGVMAYFAGRTVGEVATMASVRNWVKPLKTLWELLLGLSVTAAALLPARRSQFNTRRRRRRNRRASAGCTRCAAIRTARSAASPASCARRCARRCAITIESDVGAGRHAPHDALRHRPLQVHLLRLLRGRPVRSMRSSRRASTSTTWRIAARTS